MSFTEIYSSQRPILSFEFFPPKEPSLLAEVKQQISLLAELNPDFVTVTYGAGGGTRGLSKELVEFVKKETQLLVCPHLTCVGHSRAEVLGLAREFEESGVELLLALRGDPPAGDNSFRPHPDGFSCARDFVAELTQVSKLNLAVAGYPESHKEAGSREEDQQYLVEKVNAGAQVIFTQLFFAEKIYFDFVKEMRARGCTVPIVPGIMPIQNASQLRRFTSMCGASIPPRVLKEVELRENDPEALKEWGIEEATRLCRSLIQGGAPGIHLYTLNKSQQIERVVEGLRG
jgi:methylenetetrahydrofolate reductase (NADPH)